MIPCLDIFRYCIYTSKISAFTANVFKILVVMVMTTETRKEKEKERKRNRGQREEIDLLTCMQLQGEKKREIDRACGCRYTH